MKAYTFFLLISFSLAIYGQNRARDLGIKIGVMKTGPLNAITDVAGVKVGHVTKIEGNNIRTGVTAILPHDGNMYQEKIPAAIYVGNGYGKLVGVTQVQELGSLETPILLTNTLGVPMAAHALIKYMLRLPGNEQVKSVNPVVGETNDGYLNDIRSLSINEQDIWEALEKAMSGPVQEGNVGAGTGTRAFGFKGGIGTASRVLPASMGGYTLGVLVQSNFGGVLTIDGAPVGEELGQYYFKDELLEQADGSCMIIVLTNAPIDSRNLERLAKRAIMGLARTGGIASNGSGDYVIAASTAENLRLRPSESHTGSVLSNADMSPLFMACIEATEEAIINSLFAAESMTGYKGRMVKELPIDEVMSTFSEKD